MNFRVSCLLFLGVLFSSFATQKSSEDYLLMIQNIYKKINSSGNIETKTLYYKVGVISVTNIPDKNVLPEQIVEMYINKTQSRYLNSEMVIFEDNIDAFTILLKDKIILWRNSARSKSLEKNEVQLHNIQDSLLSHLSVLRATEISEDNISLKKVETKMQDTYQSKYNIKGLNFVINEHKQTINKIEIHYLHPVKNVVSIKYNYYKIDYDSRIKGENSPVKELIFSSGNTLRDKYKGYRIRDIRKKQTKIKR